MKKIYRLREWLTTEESAKHLSLVLGEEVTKADLLRMGLDGHLTLSVNLVNKAWARLGRVTLFKDMPMREFPYPLPGGEPGQKVMVPAGKLIDDTEAITDETRFVCFDEKVVSVEGIWDLTMKGAEALDVEHDFQQLTDGPAIDLVCIDGVFLSRGDDQWAQLQDRFSDREVEKPDGKKLKVPGSFYPAGGLPRGSHLVVRMSALTEFQSRLEEPKAPGSGGIGLTGTRERETLLKLVIGMAIDAYRHDPGAARSSTPGEIAADLARHGISITDDTVRKYLKEAAATVLPKSGKG